MAKNLIHKKVTQEQVVVKGIMSDDCSVITYLEDKTEKEANIYDYLKLFAGKSVKFEIVEKNDECIIPDESDAE